jgi:hypothetical protein
MSTMLSLVDVLPRHEQVNIGSDEICVYGITGEDIGKILMRFPDAFAQLYGHSNQLMNMDPELLGALMAASQRNGEDVSMLGNDKAERRARNFSIGDQMKIMKALGRCTFPDGVGPFLEDLTSMSSATNEAIEVIVKAVSKEQPTESQPMPRPSEPPSTPASGS